jgi:hypothetical protein
VGCDGLRSSTRELSRIGFEGDAIARSWAVYDLSDHCQPRRTTPRRRPAAAYHDRAAALRAQLDREAVDSPLLEAVETIRR